MAKTAKIKYPKEVLVPVEEHLKQQEALLNKRKKEILETDPYKDKGRLNDNAAIDADAEEQVGHMRTSALRKFVDRSLVQIRKALTRIRIGKYGICENCGGMIDTDRLMIMPEATLCVKCEAKREK